MWKKNQKKFQQKKKFNFLFFKNTEFWYGRNKIPVKKKPPSVLTLGLAAENYNDFRKIIRIILKVVF